MAFDSSWEGVVDIHKEAFIGQVVVHMVVIVILVDHRIEHKDWVIVIIIVVIMEVVTRSCPFLILSHSSRALYSS